MSLKKEIAKRITNLRNAHQYTQASVAAFCEISRASYGSYEEGRAEPAVHVLLKLCDLYGLPTINDLLGQATAAQAKTKKDQLYAKYMSLGKKEKGIVDMILK